MRIENFTRLVSGGNLWLQYKEGNPDMWTQYADAFYRVLGHAGMDREPMASSRWVNPMPNLARECSGPLRRGIRGIV